MPKKPIGSDFDLLDAAVEDARYERMDAPRLPGLDLVRRLGGGGMGAVFLAKDLGSGTQVAVKVLAPRTFGTAVRRFRREFHAMLRLEHPGIVRVERYDVHGPYEYFVLEYVRGQNLRHYLLPSDPSNGLRQPTQELLRKRISSRQAATA